MLKKIGNVCIAHDIIVHLYARFRAHLSTRLGEPLVLQDLGSRSSFRRLSIQEATNALLHDVAVRHVIG